jgi:virginiamycin B lyase
MKQIPTRLSKLAVATCILAVLAFVPELFAATDFPVPPGRAAGPITITLGSDHNLWFTENAGLKIGRITPAGVITEFPIAGSQGLTGITSGPDGNLWFTDEFAGKIGRISTTGTGLATFSLPTNSHPQGITAGPDGNLWFVDQTQSVSAIGGAFKIGKITLGGQITEYTTGINAGVFDAENYYPAQITKGPDGNLWFTNPQAGGVGKNLVGKMTVAGAVTIYPTGDTPFAITAGPDGNLWTLESGNVAKITTSGVETEYPLTQGVGMELPPARMGIFGLPRRADLLM